MSTIKSEESNTALLLDKVASARAGDPKEAIAAAISTMENLEGFPQAIYEDGVQIMDEVEILKTWSAATKSA